MVPGEYKVYAWEDMESTAWRDPEFMKPPEGRGTSVTVGESGKAGVQVNLIPAESEKRQDEVNNRRSTTPIQSVQIGLGGLPCRQASWRIVPARASWSLAGTRKPAGTLCGIVFADQATCLFFGLGLVALMSTSTSGRLRSPC